MSYPAIYIIFIGGAADKESFLWGNVSIPFTDAWPHNIVGQLSEYFKSTLQDKVKEKQLTASLDSYCKIEYLSYTEAFFEELKSYDPIENKLPFFTDDKLTYIKNNIGNHTKVFIVGHSLGGWNSAHSSYILAKQGINVEYLVTLDPVGTGNHEVPLINPLMKKAQIYTNNPIPVAKKWINIQARRIVVSQKQTAGQLEDCVAWAGGQWLIKQHYSTVDDQLCEVTNFSHKDVLEMFTYPTKLGYSASENMLKTVIKTIKKAKRQQYNLINWLKKSI